MYQITLLFSSLLFLVSSLVGRVSAQTWTWKKRFPQPYTPNWNFPSTEVLDILPLESGELYSSGMFVGSRMRFGSQTIFADTLLHTRFLPSGPPPETYFSTSWLASQNAQGDYIWVKTLSGSGDFYDEGMPQAYFRRSGLKVAKGENNTLYAVGFCTGDSLVYDGSPIFRQDFTPLAPTPRHLVILKTQANGQLIWSRTFRVGGFAPGNPVNTSPLVTARFVSFGPSGLEILASVSGTLFLGQDSVTTGTVRLTFSQDGQVQGFQKQTLQGPDFIGGPGNHLMTRRQEDGRWIVGYFNNSLTGLPSGSGSLVFPNVCFFDLYNPAFSTRLSRWSFQILSPTLADGQTLDVFPQDIRLLPDGKWGFLLGLTNPPNAAKLVMNGDTLDIAPLIPIADGPVSLYVKTTDGDCIKQVEPRDQYYLGQSIQSPNGNLLTAGGAFENGKTRFTLIDRNGQTGGTLSLDSAILPAPRELDYMGGTTQNFQIRTSPNGNKGWICAGNFVGQFTYPDPVLGDESAAGCLRGNAITSTREVQKSEVFLSQSQNGVEIRATDNQSGRYRILGSDGRLLEEGSWKGSQTPIGCSIRAKGVYQVVLSGSGNPKTLRFVPF